MEDAEVIAPVAAALVRIEWVSRRQRFVSMSGLRGWGLRIRTGLCRRAQQRCAGVVECAGGGDAEGARDVRFDRCEFGRLGTFAVSCWKGAAKCLQREPDGRIAGGGFRVNGGMRTGIRAADLGECDCRQCGRPYGQVYPSAVGGAADAYGRQHGGA
jgi:hypothetical protein